MEAKTHMRGFFFVVIVFIILGYILVSISVWTSALQESERRYADRFRTSNLELVSAQISDEQIDKFTRIAMYNALDELNRVSVDNPVVAGALNAPDEFRHVNESFYELITSGAASPTHFEDQTRGASIGQDKSFKSWIDRLNKSIVQTGMQVSNYSITRFNVFQNSRENVSYSIDLNITLEEKSRVAFIEREYKIRGNVSIQGLIDPAIAREWNRVTPDAQDIQKQFFFNENYTHDVDIVPTERVSGGEGQGWFYGPLVSVTKAPDIPPGIRSTYILFGRYDEITNLATSSSNAVDYTEFGAYILTNNPIETPNSCTSRALDQSETFNAITYRAGACNPLIDPTTQTDKPFIVSFGFDANRGQECPEGFCALFVTRYSPQEVQGPGGDPERKRVASTETKVYNMERLRDFAACGYYTGNINSPSYFQRLFRNSFARSNRSSGIETFLVGSYIGGEGTVGTQPVVSFYSDDLSRADRELFTNQNGIKIRGMPGCKTPTMCAQSQDSLVGHFRLGTDSQNDFLGTATQRDKIACLPNQGAECG